MRSTGLIRFCGDIELPAVGRWDIPAGQPLDGSSAQWLRTNHLDIRTEGGLLSSVSGPPNLRLCLQLSSDCAQVQTGTWTFTGSLAAADRFGRWRFDGTISCSGQESQPLQVATRYHGVFDRGARTVAWLSVASTATSLGRRKRPPKRGRARSLGNFQGDINAERARLEGSTSIAHPRLGPCVHVLTDGRAARRRQHVGRDPERNASRTTDGSSNSTDVLTNRPTRR